MAASLQPGRRRGPLMPEWTGNARAPHAALQPHSARQQRCCTAHSGIFYAQYPLSRAEHLRSDEAQVAQLLASPTARLLPLSGSKVLVTMPPGDLEAPVVRGVWIQPAADVLQLLDPLVAPVFLGLDGQGAPHFAGNVAPSQADALAQAHAARWEAARSVGPAMSPGDASLVATAAGLVAWHRDTQYSGASGAATVSQQGGWARVCSATQRSTYPRIDPAIITLVTAGDDWALLGRKAGWPAGRYSTLAGFLEVGETLEQALVREVAEEAGVAVDLASVRYVASQPWPFPRSLMVAFLAQAAEGNAGGSSSGSSGGGGGGVRASATEASTASSTVSNQDGSSGGEGNGASQTPQVPQRRCRGLDLLQGPGRVAALDVGIRAAEVEAALLPALQPPVPQPGEMEDVRWFHRDWLRRAVGQGSPPEGSASGFAIPGPYSLAHMLITGWLGAPAQHDGQAAAWAGEDFPQVNIDEGVQKYVLLRLTDPAAPNRTKLLVWGAAAAAYHNHVLLAARARAQPLGLEVEVVGGGRIEHYPQQGVVSVYGYSAAFGPAPHEVSAALLRRWYPFYSAITVSYEGY